MCIVKRETKTCFFLVFYYLFRKKYWVWNIWSDIVVKRYVKHVVSIVVLTRRQRRCSAFKVLVQSRDAEVNSGFPSKRINLSPFTKDFRGGEPPLLRKMKLDLWYNFPIEKERNKLRISLSNIVMCALCKDLVTMVVASLVRHTSLSSLSSLVPPGQVMRQ